MKSVLFVAFAVVGLSLAIGLSASTPPPEPSKDAEPLPQPEKLKDAEPLPQPEISMDAEPLPQPEKPKEAESLPPAPKVDPESVHIENPKMKGLIIEVYPDKKRRRVLIETEVCLREGSLEQFMCKKGTKEHEAIVRADIDAVAIHEALIFAGAEPGKPTQFVNPKTEQAEYKPATGTKIDVKVHYTRDGKTYTHPAQEWIWNPKKKEILPYGWVFAGSTIFVDPDTKQKYYGANSGDVISISNFPYSMLEIPVEISKDDANLEYEAKTERIPPLRSKVWVILEPVLAKK